MKAIRMIALLLLAVLVLWIGVQQTAPEGLTEQQLDENGWYNSAEDVSLYLHLYGELPSNYLTKDEAEALGWTGGSPDVDFPGRAIGGDIFGNYEGLLPQSEGRIYRECDVDTLDREYRGAKRLVYSNDGLIFYTENHYDSFVRLYPKE
ncbi:MAG: ribonuclease domain-containing protein [Eubacteriales bacterium]|nr:ribonuclease domain-containing protein [Eubacteriales bacterium]MDD3863383.1 ribonuclease domain-containing protein [Eubacteriales bacterium]